MLSNIFIWVSRALQVMKKLFTLLLLLLVACVPVKEKIFVANEASGSISIIDASSLKEIDRVSLVAEHDGAKVEYAPHNVQVIGNKVLITANTAHKHGNVQAQTHSDHGDTEVSSAEIKIPTGVIAVEAHEEDADEEGEHPDQLIIMDAKSHKIVARVDLEVGAHLAHVVSDGVFAYATATDTELLYKVNLETKKFSPIVLPKGSMPHGIRLTTDNKTAVIAAMHNGLLILDLESKHIDTVELPGKGVQAGVVNNIVMASVFDTKQLALYDLSTKGLSFVDLPDAKGPIQMYPTPDGKYVYIADQGVYFDQPPGTNTYKISLDEKKVVASIETGYAPHGVVVSADGKVWVTNLNGNSVSVIQDDKKIAEIDVGAAPNGISYWSPQ
jgi:YVTN family beta-propeller protein